MTTPLEEHWEPWAKGYGRRLMFRRSWVRIPALYTGWTFFTFICCKKWNVCLKRGNKNKTKKRPGWPIFIKNIGLFKSCFNDWGKIYFCWFCLWINFFLMITFQCDQKKLPKVYKSCPKMISWEKWYILPTLQKFLRNVKDLGKFIVAKGFKKLPKVQ